MTDKVKENLRNAGYDGSLLKPNDLLLALDSNGEIILDTSGGPLVLICNFEFIWKLRNTTPAC